MTPPNVTIILVAANTVPDNFAPLISFAITKTIISVALKTPYKNSQTFNETYDHPGQYKTTLMQTKESTAPTTKGRTRRPVLSDK